MATEKFTKADLVGALHEKTGLDRKEIRRVMDFLLHEMKTALVRRSVIELRGFGTFEVKVRKARGGLRNPRTGEAVSARPYGGVCFRPGRELREEIRDIALAVAPAAAPWTTPEEPSRDV
jgi:integration host factor subunit beta